MTKIYALITATLLLTSLSAQDYNITPNDTVEQTIVVGSYTDATINMDHDNSTTDSLRLQWEIIENTIPTGWDYSICDYTNCYAGNITSGTMSKFGVNQSGFIKINLLASTAENAQIRFKVYNAGNAVNADTITFIYNAVLGLDDIELGQYVNVFPNPSTGSQISISKLLPGTKLAIINTLGQTVLSPKNYSESLTISNLDLRMGVYFIRFEKANKLYATRKLVVR